MRPTSRRLRRRKAVSEVSLPGSGHSSPSADDPQRPIRFLQTGQSAKSRFCELEFSAAAIGDLNLPAISGRSWTAASWRRCAAPWWLQFLSFDCRMLW